MAGVGPAATMLVQGEEGLFTIFSLAHFLWGAVFHLVWLVLALGDAWVSLLIISTAAMVFEILESSKFVGSWVWDHTWGFRMGQKYRPDTLANAFSDALFSNLGFFLIQLAEVLSEGSSGARVGMAIGCGAVALLFAAAFCTRQAALGHLFARPTRSNPMVPVGAAAVPVAAAAADRRWFDIKI